MLERILGRSAEPEYLDLPAEFEYSEGLDGPWDDDQPCPAVEIVESYIAGDQEVSREAAVKGILSIIGTKLEDADLTKR